MTLTNVVVASRNKGKIVELQRLCEHLPVRLLSVADLPGVPEVVEDADTFAGNALKKAREVAAATGMAALADDSGLEVDALGGAPGVYSARYAGDGGDAANNAKLLAALGGVPAEKRTARFRCVLAYVEPGPATELVADGACEGTILTAPRGTGGFGYDPLFFIPEIGMTFAECPLETKVTISHRARAMASLLQRLARHFHVENGSAEG